MLFKEMFEKNISLEDVIDAVHTGEVIKEYTDDKPYPSY
jgi:hypothetical protein